MVEKSVKSLFDFLTNLSLKHFFISLLLLSIFGYFLSVMKVGSILWGDSLYYYSYTSSILVDKDIDFSNQAFLDEFGFPNDPETSPVTALVINKFSPGSSVMWMPGFIVGQFLSFFFSLRLDGYSLVTQFAVGLTAVAFSVTGLYFVYLLIQDLFSKKVGILTVIVIFLTTQMFYYTVLDPLNSHSASFMLSSLILYKTYTSSKQILTWKKVFPLGLLGGLLVLVRNQDVVVLIPSFIYLLTRKNTLMDKLNWVVLFWGNVFLMMSVQLFFTLEMYGQFGSPYLIGGEVLSWFKPDFIRVLFSFGNGLFVFAPVLILALAGLIVALKQGYKSKPVLFIFSLISLSVFLLQLYVVASWGREIIGGPYGSRMFISIIPFLSIGLSFLLQKYLNTKYFYTFLLIVLIALFLNNLSQTALMLYRF